MGPFQRNIKRFFGPDKLRQLYILHPRYQNKRIFDGGDQAVVLTCQGQNKPFYVSLERAHLEVHKIFLVNLVGTMALAMTMSLACSMF